MKMAELRHGVIPKIENSLKDSETINHKDLKLLRNRVTEEIVANVVSKWTGIPVSSMMLSEKEKLLNLEKKLSESDQPPGPFPNPSGAQKADKSKLCYG